MALHTRCVGPAGLWLTAALLGWSQPSLPFCDIQPTPQTLIRAEGVAELVGDIGLMCGGDPVAVGRPIPTYTVTVTLNSSASSRVFQSGLSEALLIIDEAYPSQPNPSNGTRWTSAGSPQNLCLSISSNNCPILETGISSGTPGGDYDGSAGHNNVFQGVPSAFNSITFRGVPISSGGVYMRITNIRANPAGFLTPPFTSGQIEAIVNVGPGSIPLASVVAFAEKSMTVTQTPVKPVPGTTFSSLSVTFSEVFGFPAAFKTWTTLQGTGVQNVPGVVYNSESGFWDNLAPPTGIGRIGIANHGTRLMVHFSGYPAGVKIVAPSAAHLGVVSGGATQNTGAIAYVVTDTNGNSTAGPKPLGSKTVTVTTDALGNAWLTYEVASSNPALSESVTIPIIIESQSTGTITGSYGPLVSGGVNPIPRFIQE